MLHTENEFRCAIASNHKEFTLLVVFADWLQEHDDPRAAGYRIMARAKKRATGGELFTIFNAKYHGNHAVNDVPDAVFKLLKCTVQIYNGLEGDDTNGGNSWRDYATRQAADDDLAQAYATHATREDAK